jgi:glycosyltransferase involved in cell wall biosynthesis
MAPTRIAVATPSRNTWSETFIVAHLQRLHEVVLVLSDGSLPQMADGKPLVGGAGLAGRARMALDQRLWRKDHRTMVQERITAMLRARHVEVLLAEYGPTGEAVLESCCAAHVPLVVHFHGYDAHKHAMLERYGNYRRLFAEAAALVVVSRTMEQQLLSLGAPREKLHYIVYGIDTARFAAGTPEHNPPHFVAVGRFTDKKAPLLTLLAFRQAWQQRPGARLTLAGDGALRESVRQLVQAWGMEDAVEMPGVLLPGQVAERMRGARAFVQHSVTPADGDMEGTPLAVLEAMASGLPVISTKHAGIPDVVAHGESGLLGAEYDVDAMAAHMLHVIDDPALAGRLGQTGRAYVEQHHRVEERVGALQQLLEQVAKAGNAH